MSALWSRTGLTCDYIVTYLAGVDAVFKALADPTRRTLLDELFREDGQTLSQLEQRFPMTRFGVMKHLRQLEEAGLVVTRRRGRENTIPPATAAPRSGDLVSAKSL